MNDKSFKFRYEKLGIPTDVTSAVLRDPTNTFGLQRVGAGGPVLPAGTPMPRISAGYYKLTIDGDSNLMPGATYEYWVEWTVNGLTDRRQKFFVAQPALADPISRYTSYDAFLRRWGTKNVREASEPDNKADEVNLQAVQDAFEFADEDIDDELRGGVVQVPLDFTPWDDFVPRKVRGWADSLAFGYLYEKRGWQEKKVLKNKVQPLVEKAYNEMQMVKNGLLQINAAPAVDSDGDTVSRELGTVDTWYQWYRYPDGVWIRV